MARVILEQPGEDITVGGRFNGFGDPTDSTVIGTRSPGEEVTVIEGDIVLDASFNAGGDVIGLPGEADEYSAELIGSRVVLTYAAGEVRISIPVGETPNTIIFGGEDSRTIRIEDGQVFIGDQVVEQSPQMLDSNDAPLAAADATGVSKQEANAEAASVDDGLTLIFSPDGIEIGSSDGVAFGGGLKGDLLASSEGMIELAALGYTPPDNIFCESQTFA